MRCQSIRHSITPSFPSLSSPGYLILYYLEPSRRYDALPLSLSALASPVCHHHADVLRQIVSQPNLTSFQGNIILTMQVACRPTCSSGSTYSSMGRVECSCVMGSSRILEDLGRFLVVPVVDNLLEQIKPCSLDRLWSKKVVSHRLDAVKIYPADHARLILDKYTAMVLLRRHGPSELLSLVPLTTADVDEQHI